MNRYETGRQEDRSDIEQRVANAIRKFRQIELDDWRDIDGAVLQFYAQEFGEALLDLASLCDFAVTDSGWVAVNDGEWTCDGCLAVVIDGDGHHVDDMRVCEHCADEMNGTGVTA